MSDGGEKYEEIRLTKRDVASRQIDAAIDLIFSQASIVPSHTLTWAALEILRGVARSQKIQTMDGEFELRIKPAHMNEFHKHIKRHYNFFKHADKDPNGVTNDFRPESTIWTLFMCCHDYRRIYGQQTWPMFVYIFWFFCRNPQLTESDLTSLVSRLQKSFGFPAKKPWQETIGEAYGLLVDGRRNEDAFRAALGDNWANAIEWNAPNP
jgi:hypothetical protein